MGRDGRLGWCAGMVLDWGGIGVMDTVEGTDEVRCCCSHKVY